MEDKITLPSELNEIAVKISEDKQQEVKKVLNQIFSGTSEWSNQVDAIEVKDINDVMSIQMADIARKNAKNARLDAEKIFDAKRKEVQSKMIDYKLEDSLWLKSKQIMQLQFKAIEEKAAWKANFIKRHEEEQLRLRNDLRYSKLLQFAGDEEISMIEVNNMSDDTFKMYLSGIKEAYDDRIAAEKKAEEERIEKERVEKLHNTRKESILHLWNFMDDGEKGLHLGNMSDIDFVSLSSKLKIKKTDYDKEQEEIRKENERLRKEADEKERLAKIEKQKREKLEAQLKAKADAEQRAKDDEEKRI